MQVAKISVKGQVTIPKFIREILELNEGDHIAFEFKDGSISIIKANLDELREAVKRENLR